MSERHTQFLLDDRHARIFYIFRSGTPITSDDALYLIKHRLFEDARLPGILADLPDVPYQFVEINPPDGWHIPE